MPLEEVTKQRVEPWSELPEESLRKIQILTDVQHDALDSPEYNLATDTLKVPCQNWACVSFVSPTGAQKSKSLGMKIRGVFDRHEDAVEHVKRLIRLDPVFDIFICDMYNWCLVPPDPEKINDQTYQNEELNTIIGGYRKNQIYAKEHFEERKREMMEQAADEVRRAALKKMEAERIVEVSPSDEEGTEEGTKVIEVQDDEETVISSGVSALDIMDAMVNGNVCANESDIVPHQTPTSLDASEVL